MKNSSTSKISKLYLETTKSLPIEEEYSDVLYTSRLLNNMKQRTDNYIIDNNILFNKLVDVQDEIKELRHIINSLYFPKPINYKYPDNSSDYSPDTIYCTPPLESMLCKQYKETKK